MHFIFLRPKSEIIGKRNEQQTKHELLWWVCHLQATAPLRSNLLKYNQEEKGELLK